MREIKFRAWDGVRMIYQGSDGYFNNVKHPKYPALQTMQLHGVMQVCEVMQFTGLLDKNGKGNLNHITKYSKQHETDIPPLLGMGVL